MRPPPQQAGSELVFALQVSAALLTLFLFLFIVRG
jgi:hypothetical protein